MEKYKSFVDYLKARPLKSGKKREEIKQTRRTKRDEICASKRTYSPMPPTPAVDKKTQKAPPNVTTATKCPFTSTRIEEPAEYHEQGYKVKIAERLDKLKKWREQREKKRAAERATKKPVFKVSRNADIPPVTAMQPEWPSIATIDHKFKAPANVKPIAFHNAAAKPSIKKNMDKALQGKTPGVKQSVLKQIEGGRGEHKGTNGPTRRKLNYQASEGVVERANEKGDNKKSTHTAKIKPEKVVLPSVRITRQTAKQQQTEENKENMTGKNKKGSGAVAASELKKKNVKSSAKDLRSNDILKTKKANNVPKIVVPNDIDDVAPLWEDSKDSNKPKRNLRPARVLGPTSEMTMKMKKAPKHSKKQCEYMENHASGDEKEVNNPLESGGKPRRSLGFDQVLNRTPEEVLGAVNNEKTSGDDNSKVKLKKSLRFMPVLDKTPKEKEVTDVNPGEYTPPEKTEFPQQQKIQVENMKSPKTPKTPGTPNVRNKRRSAGRTPGRRVRQLELDEDEEVEEQIDKEERPSAEVLSDSVSTIYPCDNLDSTFTLEETATTSKTPENKSNPVVYVSPFVTVSRGKDCARSEYKSRSSRGGEFLTSPDSTGIKAGAAYFTQLCDKEIERIERNCKQWEEFKLSEDLPEEAINSINVALGQSNLLLTKKMEYVRNLIRRCLYPDDGKPVTCTDLHGYWDLVMIEVNNLDKRFENLAELRENNWEVLLVPFKEVSIPQELKPKRGRPRKDANKETNSQASSGLRAAMRAARKKLAGATNLSVEKDTIGFEGGFFKITSPVKQGISPRKPPRTRKGLRVSVLDAANRKSSRISTGLAMMNATRTARISSGVGEGNDVATPSQPTPTKGILKLATPRSAMKKAVIFKEEEAEVLQFETVGNTVDYVQSVEERGPIRSTPRNRGKLSFG